MRNVFSVDVEDYFQVSGFADSVRPEMWGTFPSRVVANTHRILRLLARRETPATFFVLGWVGERFPDLVRDIQKDGHEIASHSYWHRLIYDLTPEQFREDLALSKRVLEDITGSPVTAFRAASFSITRKSLWALDILAEEGFTADSSIFPVHHDRYGIPGTERKPYAIATRSGTLREFPPASYPVGSLNIPVAGGGYFRLFPTAMTTFCLGRINAAESAPFMFYIHPWEVDPDQPRLPGKALSRWRHYQNLARTESKLDSLLGRFSFATLRDVLADTAPACAVTPDDLGPAPKPGVTSQA